MKKLFFLAFAAMATLAASATQYCQTIVASNDAKSSIQLSCELVSAGNYRITIEGENLNGLGGSFYNPGGVDLRSVITSSTSTKIVMDIAAASAPSLYTPLYVMMPGETVFTWPNDVEWGTCSTGGDADTEAPALTSATLASKTHNSAVIAVAATDNVGVYGYKVFNGAAQVGGLLAATDGNITVTGLSANTAYTLTVKAVDAAGNLSNGIDVEFTTDAFYYCDAPFGHLKDANFGDANGRILLTVAQLNATTVRITVKPNTAAGCTKNLDLLYVAPNGQGAITVGEDIEEGAGETSMYVDVVYTTIPDPVVFNLEWSQPAWGGRWAATGVSVSQSEFCAESPATLDESIKATVATRKFIENGRLYFEKDGQIFDALGRMVK